MVPHCLTHPCHLCREIVYPPHDNLCVIMVLAHLGRQKFLFQVQMPEHGFAVFPSQPIASWQAERLLNTDPRL
jgi:hypothetical protein